MYSEKIKKLITGIQEGDEIKVTLNKKEHTGILMPSTELNNSDMLIVKLRNGYNIGLLYSSGMNIKRNPEIHEEIEQKIGKQKEQKKINFIKDKPSVSLITTGGTITSKVDYKTGGVISLIKPKELLSTVPELADIIDLRKILSPFNIMSENMTGEHWQKLAEEVASVLKEDRGVIVTHGTDTLHFTAAALSFMLPEVPKPVVLTGSQRSSDRPSSDAFMNLICSSYIAGYSEIASVGICMHSSLSDKSCYFIRGTKVKKMHTSRRDAFRPINDVPLAEVFPDGKIKILNENYRKTSKSKVKLDTKFSDGTALVKWYPDSDPDILNYYVKKGKQAILIEANGLGHVSTKGRKAWTPVIKEIVKSGIPIFTAPHMLYGRINADVYSNLRELYHNAGAIPLEDILPETAYVKLGWVLGHTNNFNKIKEMMFTNYAGEFNSRTLPETFLY